MCGRYSVLTEDEIIEVRSVLQEVSMRLVKDDIENFPGASNEILPTDKSPIITKSNNGISFETAKFGFKKWDGKGVIINARSETIGEKGMFSKHLKTDRCVVPTGEYYEWREQSKDESKNTPSIAQRRKSKRRKSSISSQTEKATCYSSPVFTAIQTKAESS